jgi:hypothetical protein
MTCAHLQVGIALFQDHPNALYPFSKMNKDQRYFVEQIVISCLNQYSVSSSSKTSNHIVMQMGGGCILYTDTQNTGLNTNNGPSSIASNAFGSLKGKASNVGNTRGGKPSKDDSNSDPSSSTSKNANARLKLKPTDVFEALCDCIFSSQRCHLCL